MIISETPQGTPEWLTERAGIPTSSSFDMIVTSAGKPSKQRQKYLYTLAAERITGVKTEHYQSVAMQNGIALEDEARSMYEFITGNEVKQVGACFPDEKRRCASSPDGLIGKDGAIEIKCPSAHTHIEYLLKGKLPVTYFAQVQGQMFVTARKYVHFFSYYPGLKPLLIKVEQDKDFIMALAIELEIFCKELDEVTERLK
jgi:putative phage-type endonuclease